MLRLSLMQKFCRSNYLRSSARSFSSSIDGASNNGSGNSRRKGGNLNYFRMSESKQIPLSLKDPAKSGKLNSIDLIKVDFESLQLFKDVFCHLCVPQTFGFDTDMPIDQLLQESQIEVPVAADYIDDSSQESAPSVQQQQQLQQQHHCVATTGKYGFAAASLGVHVKYIRKHRFNLDRRFRHKDVLRLQEMGFVWEVAEYKFQQLLRALRSYNAIYGSMSVPTTFVVPAGGSVSSCSSSCSSSGDSSSSGGSNNGGVNITYWERELWGYRLGQACRQVRNKAALSQWRDALRREGFIFDPLLTTRARDMKLAVALYQRLNAADTDAEASVMTDEELLNEIDSIDHEDAAGTTTVATAAAEEDENIRVLAYPQTPDNEARAVLTVPDHLATDAYISDSSEESTISSSSKKNSSRGQRKKDVRSYNRSNSVSGDAGSIEQTEISPALLNKLRVPRRFRVPIGDSRWPKRLWGMKLGYMLHNIRYNGYYKSHLQQEETAKREASSTTNIATTPATATKRTDGGSIKHSLEAALETEERVPVARRRRIKT